MKECSKCKETFENKMFYKDKSSKDGLRYNCKNCSKKYRDETKEYSKDYRERNKQSSSDKWKSKYYEDKSIKKESNKRYYENNKESVKKKVKEYYINNTDSIKIHVKEYQRNNKPKRNSYLMNRRHNDEVFRLTTNIRNLILNSFYNMGYTKESKTESILGCSFKEFKSYLESKFEEWMSWENRGLYNGELNYGWDIDHIIPLSEAINIEDLYKLNHYSNLQPLCSKVNRDIKKNNIWQDLTTL